MIDREFVQKSWQGQSRETRKHQALIQTHNDQYFLTGGGTLKEITETEAYEWLCHNGYRDWHSEEVL